VTDFLNRPLSAVQRIFRFLNGESQRSAVDISAAIQPVFDYSRQSELGARGILAAGFLELGQTLVHVGSGALFATTDPYASFNAIGQFSDFNSTGQRKDRLWLLGLFATTSSSSPFTDMQTGIDYQDPLRSMILARWDSAVSLLAAAQPLNLLKLSASGLVAPPAMFPIYFPPGALWNTRSNASGAVTNRVHARWWAGPLGTTPPGMR